MGQPQITAAQQKYDKVVGVTFTGLAPPPPQTVNTDDMYLLHNTNSRHYNSLETYSQCLHMSPIHYLQVPEDRRQ